MLGNIGTASESKRVTTHGIINSSALKEQNDYLKLLEDIRNSVEKKPITVFHNYKG